MEETVQFHGKIDEPFELEIWMVLLVIFLVYVFVWPRFRRKVLQADANLIPPDKLNSYLEDDAPILLVDVRIPSEFDGLLGHIPSAVNLPLRKLEAKLDDMTGETASLVDTHVVIIGWSENDGYKAYKVFEKAGFEKVEVVDGGIRDWLRAGFNTERKGLIVDMENTRDQLMGETKPAKADEESAVSKGDSQK